MEQAQPMIPDYKIVKTTSLEKMEEQVDALMKDGWQIVGEAKDYIDQDNGSNYFYRELVKLRPDQEAIDKANQEMEHMRQHFLDTYNAMDERVKDLLELNHIELLFMNGNYFTNFDGKTEEGISPYNILEKLKKSKHYPIDMDDQTVINAIAGVS